MDLLASYVGVISPKQIKLFDNMLYKESEAFDVDGNKLDIVIIEACQELDDPGYRFYSKYYVLFEYVFKSEQYDIKFDQMVLSDDDMKKLPRIAKIKGNGQTIALKDGEWIDANIAVFEDEE